MGNQKITEILDTSTGELSQKIEYTRYKKVKTEKFILVYLDNVIDITNQLSPMALKVLHLMWRDCIYSDETSGNIIYTLAHNKNVWVKDLDSKMGTINNAITEINNKGFTKKIATAVYLLNPSYFFKGDRNERLNALEEFKKEV